MTPLPEAPLEPATHPDAAESDCESIRRMTATVSAHSTAIASELERVRSEAAAIRERAWVMRLRSTATRDHAAALRARLDVDMHVRTPDAHVRWFALRGELGGRPVRARWEAGRLECAPELLTQAQLLVELRTVFVNNNPPAKVEATLSGPAAAVMLTLAR